MRGKHDFDKLLAFMERLPAIQLPAGRKSIGCGSFDNGNWWVKFSLDTSHPLAWRHVQELGFVLNYVSVTERLPTVFMPVSPPPYLNGGVEFLSWVIESTDPLFTPDNCVEWLEGRLPRPVDDPTQWRSSEDLEPPPTAEERPSPSDRRLPDLEDCEAVGQKHKWFNVDNVSSACYNCRVVRPGQLWRR